MKRAVRPHYQRVYLINGIAAHWWQVINDPKASSAHFGASPTRFLHSGYNTNWDQVLRILINVYQLCCVYNKQFQGFLRKYRQHVHTITILQKYHILTMAMLPHNSSRVRCSLALSSQPSPIEPCNQHHHRTHVNMCRHLFYKYISKHTQIVISLKLLRQSQRAQWSIILLSSTGWSTLSPRST